MGLAQCCYNIGMAISPTIGGAINDYTNYKSMGYFYESLWWASLAFVALIFSIILFIVDFHDKTLNNPTAKPAVAKPPPLEVKPDLLEGTTFSDAQKNLLLEPSTSDPLT